MAAQVPASLLVTLVIIKKGTNEKKIPLLIFLFFSAYLAQWSINNHLLRPITHLYSPRREILDKKQQTETNVRPITD